MLHKHLQSIKCPICQSSDKWNSEGSSNDYHITEGMVYCKNKHKWVIKQEILRLDIENSDGGIIYHERELTGYPKEVNETERLEFLKFIEDYFQKINFSSDTVVVNGSSILFYRYLNDNESTFITINKDEKLLRQLHETIVRKRLHNSHSFVVADNIEVTSANQFHIFKKSNDVTLGTGDKLIQFNSLENEASGLSLWRGQKYFLEEITG